MVIIPLYDTLGPDACAFIINQGKANNIGRNVALFILYLVLHKVNFSSGLRELIHRFIQYCFFFLAGIKITVCDASKVDALLKSVDKCEDLKYIIKIGDSVTEEERARAKEFGVEILTFGEVEVSTYL